MADQKITQLTEDTAPASSDLVKTTKDPAGTPLDRKVTLLNLVKGALSGIWTPASSSGPASFALHEDTDNGSNYARITAPAALGGDRTLTLPDETGTLVSTATLGVYAAYSPTVAQNGTRTTSAMSARYTQNGKSVHAYGQCTVSNTGTAGNAITVGLPVSANSAVSVIGSGYIYDQSAGAVYLAVVLVESGTMNFRATHLFGGGKIGADPSFAVASGDIISWNVMYEAA